MTNLKKKMAMHTWVIENCDMCFQPTESNFVISSPWFGAGNPRHSVWRLELFFSATKENKRILQYHINILNGSIYRDYTCKILLVGPEGETQEVKGYSSWFPCLNENIPPIEKQFFRQDTLTLKFMLTFKSVPTQYIRDLTDLSGKISTLYGNKQFSDIMLYTSKKEFILHKFLLRKRAPELFNGLGLHNENIEKDRVEVDDISTPVLHTILKYVYSGKVDSLPEKYLPELYATLKKFQLYEFDREILQLRSSSTIYTHMKVERRTIYWYLNVKKSLVDEESSYVSKTSNDEESSYVSETSNDEESSGDESCIDFRDTLIDKCPFLKHIYIAHISFLVKVLFYIKNIEIVLQINIRCASSLEHDIWLKCATSLGVEENKLVPHSEELLLFTNEKNMHYLSNPSYCRDSIKETLILKLNLAVSKGEHTCSVDGAILTSPELQSVYGMGLLSYQLVDLICKYGPEKDVNEMEDLTVNFENGTVKAHKAVLAIGSPQFYSKIFSMTEKNIDQIDVLDVDFRTGKRLLESMYSGILCKSPILEYDMKLYVAAKNSRMFSLFRKCSRFLVYEISKYNVCEMLVLAYNNKDEYLFQEAQRYIESNREVLNSDEWISLIDDHNNYLLVSRILTRITRLSLPASQK